MQYQVSLREINHNLAHFIKVIEEGNEIIITRHGKPVARIVSIPHEKLLSSEQIEMRRRLMILMQKGISLGGEKFNRDDLHER